MKNFKSLLFTLLVAIAANSGLSADIRLIKSKQINPVANSATFNGVENQSIWQKAKGFVSQNKGKIWCAAAVTILIASKIAYDYLTYEVPQPYSIFDDSSKLNVAPQTQAYSHSSYTSVAFPTPREMIEKVIEELSFKCSSSIIRPSGIEEKICYGECYAKNGVDVVHCPIKRPY